jgi:hypothetical protein
MMVCDLAIGRVREDLDAVLRGEIQYTHVDGQGTLVEAGPSVDADRFQLLIQEAISAAQAAAAS